MSTVDPITDAATPWLDEHEQRAWRHFIRGTRRLLDHLDTDLRAHGLSHDDYAALVWLSEADGGRLRMSELAEQEVVSRSRLSRHIGRLEQRGLVRREPCPTDRRGSFAVLTTEGRALLDQTAPHHVAGVRASFIDHIEPEELMVVERIFGRIEAALGPVCAEAIAAEDERST